MAPRFSVIVPAYNAEAYLPDALASIERQAEPSLEVVIVDDGSNDRTSDLADRWVRSVSVRGSVVRQANRGIGAARNAGIRRAQGEFLAFLDADDVWKPHKLQRVTAYLDRHAVDLVCHDEEILSGSRQGVLRYGPRHTFEALLLEGNCLSTSATVVRRALVEAVGGFSEDLSLDGVEDYDLWLRLAAAGCRFGFLHEVCGSYRLHPTSISSRIERHCQHTLNLLARHAMQLDDQQLTKLRLRRRQAAVFRNAARSLMRAGDHSAARKFLSTARRQFPLSWRTWVLSGLNQIRVTV